MIYIVTAHMLEAVGMVARITGAPGSTFVALAACTEQGPKGRQLHISQRATTFPAFPFPERGEMGHCANGEARQLQHKGAMAHQSVHPGTVRTAALVVILVAGGLVPVSASAAPSAETAKRCMHYSYVVYPWKRPGTVRMSGDRQAYFRDCMAKDGNIPPPTPTDPKVPRRSDSSKQSSVRDSESLRFSKLPLVLLDS
jgi:hypothetical protein